MNDIAGQWIGLSDLREHVQEQHVLRPILLREGRVYLKQQGIGRNDGDSKIQISSQGVQTLINKGTLTLKPESPEQAAFLQKYKLHH